MLNKRKTDKINTFLGFIKDGLLKDKDKTAETYTKNKGQYGYSVVKLKSGYFAVLKNNEIIFKHQDVDECKAECVMQINIENGSMNMFINKL